MDFPSALPEAVALPPSMLSLRESHPFVGFSFLPYLDLKIRPLVSIPLSHLPSRHFLPSHQGLQRQHLNLNSSSSPCRPALTPVSPSSAMVMSVLQVPKAETQVATSIPPPFHPLHHSGYVALISFWITSSTLTFFLGFHTDSALTLYK